ncbi:MAG TPA: hypothetical protein VK902_09025 [Rubrobacter sp.]|nr:hypothetical protein [Rubrobacter sp.]
MAVEDSKKLLIAPDEGAHLPMLDITHKLTAEHFGGAFTARDGSKQQPKLTAGLDLGDKYSYLCLIDTLSGEVIEEGLLCAPPQRPSGDASPPSSICE